VIETVIPPFRNQPLVLNDLPTQVTAEFLEQIARLLEQLQIESGNGTPESSVLAGPDKLYRDTATNTLYIKTTETGNTGWVSI